MHLFESKNRTGYNLPMLEGSTVLEKLAEIEKLDEFFDAIDSDDFDRARALMKKAGIDGESIQEVLKQMRDSD